MSSQDDVLDTGSEVALIHPVDGMEMILIPAGGFIFGIEATAANMRDRIPPEKRELPAFFMDAHEVTNEQYWRFVEATGHPVPDHWVEGKAPDRAPDHPVVCVSFEDTLAYCVWAGRRLPTELEWEKAARGTEGREFPWGTLIGSARCNCYEMKTQTTTPVRQYPKGRSPYGVWDTAGNVWEWTTDWYDERKTLRVVRGGSHNLSSTNLRCTLRYGIHPDRKRRYCGFRCVMDQE
jgi:formylglycine-generating enzyme required for sulfatase activity